MQEKGHFIVKVKYYSETTGQLSDREYTYYSAEHLNVGDIVTVPVRDTTGKAKVSAVDVPEAEIASFRDKVKTIPAGSRLVESTIASPEPAMIEELEKFPVPRSDPNAWRTGEEEVRTEARDRKINLCDTCNLKGQFPTCMEENIEFGDGRGNDNIIKCDNYEGSDSEPSTETALATRPGADEVVIGYYNQGLSLQHYAEERAIATPEDAKAATDDLSVMSWLKKAMEAKSKEYQEPHREALEAVRETYKILMAPVLEADRITRDKMLAYQEEQERRRLKQEEINQKRIEAAEEEMKLKGEITESVNLVEVAPEVVKKVSTQMGTAGQTAHWTYEVFDFALLPDAYKVADTSQLSAIARSHHDKKEVPGVRFYNAPTITVRAR